jgi:hypothetical protein
VIVLIPAAVLALVIGLMLLIAWIFDLWLPVLFAIPLVAVVAELIWRNWWGDRWSRERFAKRNAKPS